MRRALLSVSDKTRLVEFARGLVDLGFELVSTGGTKKSLADAGLRVTAVSEVTGFPEIMDGRVKTLHPRIHGGLLADRARPEHCAALEEHGIDPIDVVAVNLYPFERTVGDPTKSFSDGVEMIDVGGPAMLRAAAKNHAHVLVVVDPADYDAVLAALAEPAEQSALRRRLAAKAFEHTAAYDAAIAGWLGPGDGDAMPQRLVLALDRESVLRYGENPHQPGALYRLRRGAGVLGGMRVLQGKELSWNNLLDADAARKLVALFADPTVAIIKHNNPCGVGRGGDLVVAYRRALAADPVSAFGSIIAANRTVDAALVAAMADLFVEVLIATGYESAALAALAARKALRVLECPAYAPDTAALELRPIDGGFLAQPPDARPDDGAFLATWTCPTRRQPSPVERRGLEFGWAVARYVKSNAIVITRADHTVGIGAGQMSRVDSCRLAIDKARAAGLDLDGAVAASDAFFPFRDGLDVLADAGVTAVVHPGGSKRDDQVVAAADQRNIALLLTGVRHFRH